MLTNVDTMETKSSNYFYCNLCNYKCCKQSLWNRHILTQKHKNLDKIFTNVDIPKIKAKQYICDCGKTYNHRQSLCVHKKKCTNNIFENGICESINIDLSDKNIILQLLQENKELKDLLAEQNKLIMDLCTKQQSQINEIYKNSNNNNNN